MLLASLQTQYEKLLTGAYTPCIKAMAVAKLRKSHLPVIDYDAMTGDTEFARPNKNVESFTPTGRQALERTRLEAERRFCGNESEVVDGSSPVEFTNEELVATLLDLRTLHFKHLT